jgi:hypothetical protein
MIAQRMRFPGAYTPRSLSELFDEELERILDELPPEASEQDCERYRLARKISEEMIWLNFSA